VTAPPMDTRSFISVVMADPPALALAADAGRVGHAHVGEEDLVELGLAGDLEERAHLDPGRLHVDEERRHAPVLGHVGVGAGQEQAERRDVGQVVHTFCPFTTHSSPSRSARVDSPATSEPAPGSLKSWHQISSEVNSGRR
jgi:hypothetical protein